MGDNNHEQVSLKNRLHDYVDGELSPDERKEVEAALPEHPDLMKEVEDIQEPTKQHA